MRGFFVWALVLVAAVAIAEGEEICRVVVMNFRTNQRREKNPDGLGDIQRMWIKRLRAGGNGCHKHRTFGWDGDKIWTTSNCRADFKVCSNSDGTDVTQSHDDIMTDMYGGDGKSVEEIEEELTTFKKDWYKGKCTCTTWGDPHFKGFDGATIHFQGICEYTLVRTTAKDLGECAFDVTVENERRKGRENVSFVKSVNIRMFGKEIQLGKNKKLIVDGERKGGSYRFGSRFRVTSSGRSDLFFRSRECRINIAWQRNNRITLTVNARYKGHMEGLCGNCNGQKADDFLLANGETPHGDSSHHRNALVGESWQVTRHRESEPDTCERPVPSQEVDDCDQGSVEIAERVCEPLRNETGPFGECLGDEGSNLLYLFEGCVTDICSFLDDTDEADNLRCKSFETMASECLIKGYKASYRHDTGCTMECPENFVYFDFTPQCLPTCDDPEPEGECLQDTSEGCICAKGYILDGDRCIEPKECGCVVRGNYLSSGEFLLTNHCNKKRSCDFDEGAQSTSVTTTDHRCGDNAHCGRVDGRRACKCNRNFEGDGYTCTKDEEKEKDEQDKEDDEREERNQEFCECIPWGDPHYRMFDGHNIDFQGTCTYMASSTNTTGGRCDYSVSAKQEHRNGVTRVAFLKEIYIKTRGVSIFIKQGNQVYVDGERRLLPYENSRKELTIVMSGKYAVLTTGCDVMVAFDGRETLYIKVPKPMGDRLTGLCGDCDGVQDYVTRDGQDVSGAGDRYVQIGNSWAVTNPAGEHESDDCAQAEPEPECSAETRARAESNDHCGRVTDRSGAFFECLADGANMKEVDELFAGCMMDACNFIDTEAWPDMLCAVNEEMAGICIKYGRPANFRTPTFCPLQCPANSVYKPAMYGCQPTCARPYRPDRCRRDQQEGCECQEGYVLDDGQCVSLDECGCRDNNGDYIPLGSRFVSEDCGAVFECRASDEGAVLISDPVEHSRCHESAACHLGEDNDLVCTCQEGFTGDGYTCTPAPVIVPPVDPVDPPTITGSQCTCVANGDPRVVQFDQGRLWVNKPCKFSLAKSESDACPFAVEMKAVAHTRHPSMSYVHEIDVKVHGYTVRLSQMMEVWVQAPNTDTYLKVEFVNKLQLTDSLWLKNEADGVQVVTDCGLTVLFDGMGEVTISVPSDTAGSVTGLCGNCDGDDMNDRTDLNGQHISHYEDKDEGHNAVARMHLVADDSSDPDLSNECLAVMPE